MLLACVCGVGGSITLLGVNRKTLRFSIEPPETRIEREPGAIRDSETSLR